MDILHSLPFFSTAITMAFALSVLSRYFKGRRLYSLLWGVGLLLYAAGTLSEAWLALSWSAFWLRAWYLTGAMLTAAWLGQGTIYLLVRKTAVAHALMALLGLASLVALVAVFTAPIDPTAFQKGVAISSQYKALLARSGLTVMLGNVLIAAGALLPASAGTLIKLGLGDWLYVSELLGAAVMFLGFWLTTQPQPNEQTAQAPAPA